MNKKISMYTQIILTIISIMFGILSIFVNDFLIIFYLFLGLDLFLLSYNNYTIYQKKYMTSVYLGFGLFMILNVILEVLKWKIDYI